MRQIKPMLVAAALAAMGGLAAPAHAADPAPAAAPAPAPAAAPAPRHQAQEGVEARIKDLHDKLHVTAAQTAQWNAVADVMRENAKSYEELIRDKHGDPATMTAVDDLHFYQILAEHHAEGVKKLAAAFDGFYGSLSPEQKKTADEVFRAHKRHHGGHPAP